MSQSNTDPVAEADRLLEENARLRALAEAQRTRATSRFCAPLTPDQQRIADEGTAAAEASAAVIRQQLARAGKL